MKFGKFIRWKIIKIVATRAALFGSNMHQIVCRLGLRPRPQAGASPQTPLGELTALPQIP